MVHLDALEALRDYAWRKKHPHFDMMEEVFVKSRDLALPNAPYGATKRRSQLLQDFLVGYPVAKDDPTWRYLTLQRGMLRYLQEQGLYLFGEAKVLDIELRKITRWKSKWETMSDADIVSQINIKRKDNTAVVFADVSASDIQVVWNRFVNTDEPFTESLRDEMYSEGKPALLKVLHGSEYNEPTTERHRQLVSGLDNLKEQLRHSDLHTVPAIQLGCSTRRQDNPATYHIQNSTADTTHAAMILFFCWLSKMPARMETAAIIGEKHDSFFFVCDDFLVDHYCKIIENIYEFLGMKIIKFKRF